MEQKLTGELLQAIRKDFGLEAKDMGVLLGMIALSKGKRILSNRIYEWERGDRPVPRKIRDATMRLVALKWEAARKWRPREADRHYGNMLMPGYGDLLLYLGHCESPHLQRLESLCSALHSSLGSSYGVELPAIDRKAA